MTRGSATQFTHPSTTSPPVRGTPPATPPQGGTGRTSPGRGTVARALSASRGTPGMAYRGRRSCIYHESRSLRPRSYGVARCPCLIDAGRVPDLRSIYEGPLLAADQTLPLRRGSGFSLRRMAILSRRRLAKPACATGSPVLRRVLEGRATSNGDPGGIPTHDPLANCRTLTQRPVFADTFGRVSTPDLPPLPDRPQLPEIRQALPSVLGAGWSVSPSCRSASWRSPGTYR